MKSISPRFPPFSTACLDRPLRFWNIQNYNITAAAATETRSTAAQIERENVLKIVRPSSWRHSRLTQVLVGGLCRHNHWGETGVGIVPPLNLITVNWGCYCRLICHYASEGSEYSPPIVVTSQLT